MRKPIPQNKDGSYTITPKKHTKVRRPPSIWPIDLTGTKLWDSYLYERDDKVQDIKTGLENPLLADERLRAGTGNWRITPEGDWAEVDFGYHKQQKGDWNQWHKDMERSLQVKPPIYKTGNLSKPSLLTKLKNRFKK